MEERVSAFESEIAEVSKKQRKLKSELDHISMKIEELCSSEEKLEEGRGQS